MKTQTTSPADIDSLNSHHAIMEKAWSVVDPSCGGVVPGRTWKDPIDTSGTPNVVNALLRHQGVTLGQVLASIEYFTATKPRMSYENRKGVEVMRITADGYRKGPAGDH